MTHPHNDKKNKKIRVRVSLAFSSHSCHLRLPKNKEINIYEAIAHKLMKKGKWGICSVLDIEELGMKNRATDDNYYRCPQRIVPTKGDKFQIVSRNIEQKGHGLSYTKKTVHHHDHHDHKKHHRSTSRTSSSSYVTPVMVDTMIVNADCNATTSNCDCGSNNCN